MLVMGSTLMSVKSLVRKGFSSAKKIFGCCEKKLGGETFKPASSSFWKKDAFRHQITSSSCLGDTTSVVSLNGLITSFCRRWFAVDRLELVAPSVLQLWKSRPGYYLTAHVIDLTRHCSEFIDRASSRCNKNKSAKESDLTWSAKL